MKFISLFTKAPNYKRFSYEPRYYDAKAEERKEREDRIRREIELERGQTRHEESSDYRKRMTGAFHSARRRSQASPSTLQSSIIRLGVLLFMSLFIMAFLTWGKVALYGFLIFVPVYFYLKFKK
jgi:cation transport ATPase